MITTNGSSEWISYQDIISFFPDFKIKLIISWSKMVLMIMISSTDSILPIGFCFPFRYECLFFGTELLLSWTLFENANGWLLWPLQVLGIQGVCPALWTSPRWAANRFSLLHAVSGQNKKHQPRFALHRCGTVPRLDHHWFHWLHRKDGLSWL